MRRGKQIVGAAIRMISSQRFGVKNVYCRTCNRWLTNASTSAASTTMGPRDVFISRAEDFIIANSAAPISPTVRGLKTVWIETMSAVCSSSSFDTGRAPTASAATDVKFWLHAVTFIPNARPTFATPEPTFPRQPSGNDTIFCDFGKLYCVIVCMLFWRYMQRHHLGSLRLNIFSQCLRPFGCTDYNMGLRMGSFNFPSIRNGKAARSIQPRSPDCLT